MVSLAGNRLLYLDGLRGIAILLVVLFHAYSLSPELYPFENQFANLPIVNSGWVGVQLFFMISGFVIALSLYGSRSFFSFLGRRWLRLFPAMLILSLVSYGASFLWPDRPIRNPELRDLLPGITFLEPGLWARLIGSPAPMLEGSFWTLYVEVKFYLLFGALYFWIGLNRAVVVLVGLFLISSAVIGISKVFSNPIIEFLVQGEHVIDGRYYIWFVVGILAFRYVDTRDIRWFRYAVFAMLIAAATISGVQFERKPPALAVGLIFLAVVWFTGLQQILSGRGLVFIGIISYPLYLVHHNIIVSLTAEIGRAVPGMPAVLMPLGPIAFVMFIAWLVTRWFEPWLRQYLQGVLIVCRRKTC